MNAARPDGAAAFFVPKPGGSTTTLKTEQTQIKMHKTAAA